ncbi:response regulator transcription factor [Actinospica sp.]|jgi:DNA-binding response OmpR family regulator|uniref:response regulator transcription factor n=1 Tax=Actinospica sp. TaxID=1872142 RepID=UPI002C1C0094|nr:response regulator transcription factor [Actinospica sp.]HWG25248.1 response regulator transcription factor [Actinospica sp.]
MTPFPAPGQPPVRVLVVEDDEGIAWPLRRGLTKSGYQVETVATGAAALKAAPADVVLLDLGLPDMDGLEVCRRLREHSDAAVIVVTARDGEVDRVVALDDGADDYLVKPFGLEELQARIRAVLRRVRPSVPGHLIGVLSVDPRARQAWVRGSEIALTPKEFDILECLIAEPGRAVSRHTLITRVWDENWYGPTRVLDVHIAALRRKLAIDGLIETLYGHGFRLVPAAAVEAGTAG